MIAFIKDQRIVYGVESICRILPIAPSKYYHRLACLTDPSKASARHQRDMELCPEIKRVWDENYQQLYVHVAGGAQFCRDLQSAFAMVTSFLATAVTTSLCGFPAARRRSAKGLKTGL